MELSAARSGAISTATAGQVMLSTREQFGAAQGDAHAGVEQGGVEGPGQGDAAGDPGGLRRLPGEKAGGRGGREGGGEKVRAGAAFSGVEAEAGLGCGVVGDFGAPVGVERGVGLAGGDDGMPRAASRERRRTLRARVKAFSGWPLVRRPPGSSPPWAASSTTEKRAAGAGGGCWAARGAG